MFRTASSDGGGGDAAAGNGAVPSALPRGGAVGTGVTDADPATGGAGRSWPIGAAEPPGFSRAQGRSTANPAPTTATAISTATVAPQPLLRRAGPGAC